LELFFFADVGGWQFSKQSHYSGVKIPDIVGLEITLEKLVILGTGNNNFWFQVGQ